MGENTISEVFVASNLRQFAPLLQRIHSGTFRHRFPSFLASDRATVRGSWRRGAADRGARVWGRRLVDQPAPRSPAAPRSRPAPTELLFLHLAGPRRRSSQYSSSGSPHPHSHPNASKSSGSPGPVANCTR